jgi:WD40 repeat protein
MKQTGLIRSGCQTWNKNILDVSAKGQFLYCSTLATHVLDSSNSFACTQVNAAHDRSLTGASIAPSGDVYATCGGDNRVAVWQMKDSKMLGQTVLQEPAVQVSWGHGKNGVAILTHQGVVNLWSGESDDVPVKKGNSSHARANLVRWNKRPQGLPEDDEGYFTSLLAVGHENGDVSVYNPATGATVDVVWHDAAVKDLQWDKDRFLLCLYADGMMALIDPESGQVCNQFAADDADMVAWLPTVSGGFVTVGEQSRIATVWNASQQDALEAVDLGRSPFGISSIANEPSGSRMLLSLVNGAVLVYDWAQRRTVFSSSGGYSSSTVFDIAYKPGNPDVVGGVSYDGSIRVWNTRTMELEHDLKDIAATYAMSWAPGGPEENRLVTANAQGQAVIWDTKNCKMLHSMSHHSKPIYRIEWNPIDGKRILSTSADNTAVVFDDTGNVIRKFAHPQAVYGCHWHPTNPKVFATGCHDGVVRVFNIDSSSSKPIQMYAGHKARVFNVKWSTLLPDHIASGSDDKTIRIWNPSAPSAPIVLRGHKHHVRALSWNPEIPFLLISGSWDGSIRLWDIRSEKCTQVIREHVADVYGLDVHPDRPFSYVSSSRDASMRFWSLDDSFITKTKLQVTLEGGQFRSTCLSFDMKRTMDPKSDVFLCGQRSRQLHDSSNEAKENTELQLYRAAFSYFTNVAGISDLFDLIESMLEDRATSAESNFQHVSDLRNVLIKRADALVAQTDSKVLRSSYHQGLEEAAEIYMRLGCTKQHCETLITLGNWQLALALAPGKSLLYWKEVAARYAAHLKDGNHVKSKDSTPFEIIAGDVDTVVGRELQENSKRSRTNALLVRVSEASQRLLVVPDYKEEEEDGQQEEEERDDVPITPKVAAAVDAACVHMSIGDPARACERLYFGDEVHLAAVLAMVLKLNDVDYVFKELAARCEALGMWDEALMALQNMQSPGREISLLCARCTKSAPEKADFYMKAGLRSIDSYAAEGESQLKEGKKSEAVLSFMIACDYERSVRLGLDAMNQDASRSSWSLAEMQQYLGTMQCAKMDALSAESKSELLLWSFYIGFQQALARGYDDLIDCFYHKTVALSKKLGVNVPVGTHYMKMQMTTHFAGSDVSRALTLAQELSSDGSIPPKLKTSVVSMKKQLEALDAKQPPASSSQQQHAFVPVASTIPLSGSYRYAHPASIVSDKPILGEVYLLEDEKSAMSVRELRMYALCCPFSPTLSGARLVQSKSY